MTQEVNPRAPGVRRPATSGPEHALLSGALACRPRLANGVGVFEQPTLPTGFPDLVIVVLSRRPPPGPARARLRDPHLRCLQHLSMYGPRTVSALAGDLLLRPRVADSIAKDLIAAELATFDESAVAARPLREIFSARRIIAVEAKVRDWRRAIDQARSNMWFSSHSLILVPTASFNVRVSDAALESGVGVLTFDGARLDLRVRPQERALPVSYGSWLLHEWTVLRSGARVAHA